MTDHQEALGRLRTTNPVPFAELVDPDEISAVAALCEERRLTPDREPIPEPLSTSRRSLVRPALAFVSAFFVVIAAAGLFALLGRGGEPAAGEPPAISEPVATTTAPLPTTTAPGQAMGISDSPWGPRSVRISDTAVGDDGSVWVATNAGLVRWLPGVAEPSVFTTQEGLPFDAVENLAIGPDHSVWIGGSGWMARLNDPDRPSWTIYPAEDSPGPMAVDAEGYVWTVAGLDRLLRFNGSSWDTYTAPELPGNDQPWSRSVAVAPDGTVWAGANDHRGLISFDGSDFTYYEMFDGTPGQSAATVAVAPNGVVWVGGDIAGDDPGTGVAAFDGEFWTHYTTDDGLLSDAARIAIGPEGTVWAVHYGADVGGVSRFDRDSWTPFPDAPVVGFPAAVDASGTLWAPDVDHSAIVGFDGSSTAVLELPALELEFAKSTPEWPDPASVTPQPVSSPDEWNPILAERHARQAPAAAVCPTGSAPNTPGPAEQDRPNPDEYSTQAADFDRVWGRILMIDSEFQTWTFDVCTNTWHEMNPEGIVTGWGSLVYDVDSDRSVLFGERRLWVYDRDRDEWERRDAAESEQHGWGGISAFYDPVSGLIVTHRQQAARDGTETRAFYVYDVDTDTWTSLGTVEGGIFGVLGYSHEVDRIVTTGVFSTQGMHLIDPRTGDVEYADQPHPEFVGGFGYVEPANGAPTPYAMSLGPEDSSGMVCELDGGTTGWRCAPSVPPRGTYSYSPFNAITYDWINERLVFIGGAIHPWGDGEPIFFDDVWSLDPATGEWLELIPPTP